MAIMIALIFTMRLALLLKHYRERIFILSAITGAFALTPRLITLPRARGVIKIAAITASVHKNGAFVGG